MAHKDFVLPALILGPADVNRALVELQAVEEQLSQARLANPDEVAQPQTSRTLDDLAQANKADFLSPDDINHLKAFLQSIQQHAPVLHISFAAEPSAAFTAKIVEWLRSNVSKYALVQVGLQPSIAAGCVLRSTNKVFDMSLRQSLQRAKPLMMDIMRSMDKRAGQPEAAVQTQRTAP